MGDKNVEIKDWAGVENWLAELIEQAKANAKRWFIISIILLVALVATNAYWIYAMNSYEYVYQDGSGQNNYNSNVNGDVTNNGSINQSEEEWEEQGN